MTMIAQVEIRHVGLPDWAIVLSVVVILLSVALLLVFFVMNTRRLAVANRAMREGRFVDAFALFHLVATQRFSTNEGLGAANTFERAVRGIEKVYRAAGITADLSKLLELRKDLLSILMDPKRRYHSVFASAVDDYLTAEGKKIRDQIIAQANALMCELPTPSNATACGKASQSAQPTPESRTGNQIDLVERHPSESSRTSVPAVSRPNIRFQCPKCGKTLTCATQAAGKRAKCPGCGQTTVVPGATVESKRGRS